MASECPKQQLHLSPICLPTGRKWVPTHRGITTSPLSFPHFSSFLIHSRTSINSPGRSLREVSACSRSRNAFHRFGVVIRNGTQVKKSPFLTDDRQWIHVTFQWIVYNSLIWWVYGPWIFQCNLYRASDIFWLHLWKSTWKIIFQTSKLLGSMWFSWGA